MTQENSKRNPYLAAGVQRISRTELMRRRRRRCLIQRGIVLTAGVMIAVLLVVLVITVKKSITALPAVQGVPGKKYRNHPAWTEDFLTVNDYSRPGTPLGKVRNIFVHYTANQGTDAAQNRSYFEQLKDSHERSASAHFIIGYDGEIIQCIPLDEMAYAVKTRNEDSISIECCYLADDGSFTEETYGALTELLAWLLDTYRLDEDAVMRHYDCGGKMCPLYFVEHEDAWEQLKKDVGRIL